MNKILKRIIAIAVIVAVFGSTALFFVLNGKITTEIKDGKLYMTAYYIGNEPAAFAFTNELSSYSIEFKEKLDGYGEKTEALSLPRIQAGRYKCKDFEKFNGSGEYTLYRYKSNKSVIILYSEYTVYVINDKTRDKTWDLYQRLISVNPL